MFTYPRPSIEMRMYLYSVHVHTVCLVRTYALSDSYLMRIMEVCKAKHIFANNKYLHIRTSIYWYVYEHTCSNAADILVLERLLKTCVLYV